MTPPSRTRVVVEFEPDGDPIRGSISSDGHPGRPFRGWLELANALEAARTPGAPPEKRLAAETAPVTASDAAARPRKD